MKTGHWAGQLTQAVRQIDKEDIVPKGYFCHEDLVRDGVKASKASRLVRRLKGSGKVHRLLLWRKQRNGALHRKPYYRILP